MLWLQIMNWLQSQEEEGQTLVEYALIIALIAIVLVLALAALATGINGVFGDIVDQLQ